MLALAAAVLGFATPVAAQGQCLSLGGSTMCGHFQNSYINPSVLASSEAPSTGSWGANWSWLDSVTTVAEFDQGFKQYLESTSTSSGFRYNMQDALNCWTGQAGTWGGSTVSSENITGPVFRYQQTALCSIMVGADSSLECGEEMQGTVNTQQPACSDVCDAFTQSMEDTIEGSYWCGSGRQSAIDKYKQLCNKASTESTATCVQGNVNEDYCGYGSTWTTGLCSYCTGQGSGDSCCGTQSVLSQCGDTGASSTGSSDPSATNTGGAGSAKKSGGSKGLSGGAIAGIVVGVVVGVLLLAALIGFFLWRRKKNSAKSKSLAAAPYEKFGETPPQNAQSSPSVSPTPMTESSALPHNESHTGRNAAIGAAAGAGAGAAALAAANRSSAKNQRSTSPVASRTTPATTTTAANAAPAAAAAGTAGRGGAAPSSGLGAPATAAAAAVPAAAAANRGAPTSSSTGMGAPTTSNMNAAPSSGVNAPSSGVNAPSSGMNAPASNYNATPSSGMGAPASNYNAAPSAGMGSGATAAAAAVPAAALGAAGAAAAGSSSSRPLPTSPPRQAASPPPRSAPASPVSPVSGDRTLPSPPGTIGAGAFAAGAGSPFSSPSKTRSPPPDARNQFYGVGAGSPTARQFSGASTPLGAVHSSAGHQATPVPQTAGPAGMAGVGAGALAAARQSQPPSASTTPNGSQIALPSAPTAALANAPAPSDATASNANRQAQILDATGAYVTPGSIVVVMHPYAAQMPDELTLAPGMRLRVVDLFDDGWGTAVEVSREGSQGRRGQFPTVCVQASS